MTFGTIKMTPEFMAEMDALDPKRGTTLQMSVTTDGSDVSREEVEAQVRKWIQARREGKCKIMTSFIEEPREPKTVQQIIDDVHAVKRLVDVENNRMTPWNGLPPEQMRDKPALHVVASALGRSPSVYRWEPELQVWQHPDTRAETWPVDMVDRKMIYLGWVQS